MRDKNEFYKGCQVLITPPFREPDANYSSVFHRVAGKSTLYSVYSTLELL